MDYIRTINRMFVIRGKSLRHTTFIRVVLILNKVYVNKSITSVRVQKRIGNKRCPPMLLVTEIG